VNGNDSPKVQQVDVNALISRIGPGDLILGLSLILIFGLSFVGGWFHIGYNTCGGLPTNQSGCDQSVTYGTLWNGFGIVPAFLLIAAMLFFVVRKLPQIRLSLPMADSVVWLIFAAVEVVLFLLYWVTSKDTYQGVNIGSQIGGPGFSIIPGWTLFVCIALAIPVAIGGQLQARRMSSLPVSVAPGAHSTAPSIPIGTVSPDRSKWFDGTTWRDAATIAPPGAPRSEDGMYWWDGAGWRVIPSPDPRQ